MLWTCSGVRVPDLRFFLQFPESKKRGGVTFFPANRSRPNFNRVRTRYRVAKAIFTSENEHVFVEISSIEVFYTRFFFSPKGFPLHLLKEAHISIWEFTLAFVRTPKY